ncbi:MAG: hypothetical protein HYX86_00920 [Chloroflexi bacterium]|nr:hypothetical protein [Chloroflexota bacterium]
MLRSWTGLGFRLTLFALILLLERGSVPPRDYWKYAVDPFSGRYVFDWLGYEVGSLTATLGDFLPSDLSPGEESTALDEYFALTQEITRAEEEAEAAHIQGSPQEAAAAEVELEGLRQRRADIEGRVERLIELQVQYVLYQQGITMFIPGLVFPPVEFELETPPWLLVLSRRERIETLERISLIPNFPLAEVEAIEAQADALGVSSLIAPTGGMASYPPIVTEEGGLAYTLGAVAHEWAHNYLYLFPLGQHYNDSQDLITMNETVANLVEEEISREVMRLYYPELYAQRIAEENRPPMQEEPQGFDFNFYMRETRLSVDELLAEGKIEEAEAYMEQRRKGLEEHGIFIRKINQAYFAFYGSYATEPSAVSPIGGQLRELLQRSGSLAAFLQTVAQMSTYEDLLRALG